MPSRTRRSSPPTIDAHSDAVLMRHIRMLKPELARTGFRMARWGEVAAATNKKLNVAKFKSGKAARRRFGVLRSVYDDDEQRESMPADVVQRMDDYFAVVNARRAAEAKALRAQANDGDEDGDEDGDADAEEEDVDSPRAASPHEEDEEEGDQAGNDDGVVEEIEFKREVDVGTVDLTGGSVAGYTAGYAFALPRSREAILFEQLQAQQKMMQSLLNVIQKDREGHRQEFREILRLATRK